MKLFYVHLYHKQNAYIPYSSPVSLAILAETKEEAIEKAKQFSPDYILKELPTESETGVEDFWRE